MTGSQDRSPLIVIAGATASGKSALAMGWAERSDTVVINADASQMYGCLRLVTARPSAADEARVAHRLYGVLDGARACSAAEWAAMAKAEIAAAHARGRVPVLVGGTGLYLRVLLDGIAPVPQIDPAVRAGVRAMEAAAAHAALARADPGAAARLNAGDRQRTARALEVVRSTGQTLADWQRAVYGGIAGEVDLRAVVVEADPLVLATRIEARLATMVAGGAPDEVAALVARKLDPELPIMKAVGVRPFAAHLAGAIALEEALVLAAAETRQYAKRQRTWFRNQTPDWPKLGAEAAGEWLATAR